MKKWYLQTYINKNAWVIENLANLNLSCEEAIIVMVINHFNDNNIGISTDLISLKSGLAIEVVDRTITTLCAKKYLEIKPQGSVVLFKLDNLFETEVSKVQSALNHNLFDVFEDEFGRPLSRVESEQIVNWTSIYDSKLIMYALKEASLYNSININYINKVLQDWKNRNVNVEIIESGDHIASKKNS